jgi:hypothetical protein
VWIIVVRGRVKPPTSRFSGGQPLAPKPQQVYRHAAIRNGEPTIQAVAEEGTRKLGGCSYGVAMCRIGWSVCAGVVFLTV